MIDAAVLDRAYANQAKARAASNAAAEARMAAQRLEQERTRTRSIGEHVQDAGVGLLQGAVGLGQVGYGLTNMLTGGFLDRGLDFADNFRETQQTLDGWKSDPLQLRKQHMMETFDNQGIGAGVLEAITNPTLIADMAISNAPQLLPGAALASRAAKVAEATSAAVGATASMAEAAAAAAARKAILMTTAGQSGGSVNVDAINEAKRNGFTDAEAQAGGMVAGLTAAAMAPAVTVLTGATGLEAAAARRLVGKASEEIASKAKGGLVAAGVKGALREGVEEYGQSYGEQVATNLGSGQQLTKGAAKAGALGALVGTPLGAGMGLMSYRPQTPVQQSVDALMADVGIVTPDANAAFDAQTTAENDALAAQAEAEAAAAALRTPIEDTDTAGNAWDEAQVGGLPMLEQIGADGMTDAERAQRMDEVQARVDEQRANDQMYHDLNAAAGVDLLPVVEEIGQPTNYAGTPKPKVGKSSAPEYEAAVDAQIEAAGGKPLLPLADDGGAALPLPTVSEHGPRVAARILADYEQNQRRASAPVLQLADLSATPMVVDSDGNVSQSLAEADAVAARPAAIVAAAKSAGAKASTTRSATFSAFARDAARVDPSTPEGVVAIHALAETYAGATKSSTVRAALLAAADAHAPKVAAPAETTAPAPTKKGKAGKTTTAKVESEAPRTAVDDQVNAAAEAADATPEFNTPNEAAPASRTIPMGEEELVDAMRLAMRGPQDIARIAAEAKKVAESVPNSMSSDHDAARLAARRNAVEETTLARRLLDDDAANHPENEAAHKRAAKVVASAEAKKAAQVAAAAKKANAEAAAAKKAAAEAEKTAKADAAEAKKAADAEKKAAKAGASKTAERVVAESNDDKAAVLDAGGAQVSRKKGGRKDAAQIADEAADVYADEVRDMAAGFDGTFNGESLAPLAIDIAEDAVTRGRRMTPEVMEVLAAKHGVSPELVEELTGQPWGIEGVMGQAQQGNAAAKHLLARAKKPKNSRADGTPTQTVSKERFDFVLNHAQHVMGENISGVDTVAELQMAFPDMALPTDMNGMYVDGQIYIVRENIANSTELGLVIAHERGHRGLEGLLGDKLTAVTNRVWANMAMRKRAQAKMAADATLTRAVAAEEVLVDMFAAGERLNPSIMSKVRAAIATFFDNMLGFKGKVVTDGQINDLLGHLARYQKGDLSVTNNATGSLGTLEDVAVAPLTMIGSPRFSHATTTLAEAIDAATHSTEPQSMAKAYKMSVDAAKAHLAGTKVAFKTGGVAAGIKGFMPLDQIRNHYAHLFQRDGANPLAELTRAKRAKEAFTNRTLVEEVPVSYAGQPLKDKVSIKGVHEAWDKFVRSPATRGKGQLLNVMTQEATLFKVFPERAGGIDEQVDIDYKGAGFTKEERAAKVAEIQKAWKAIGPEGQLLFKQAQGLYSKARQDRHTALADVVATAKGIPRTIVDTNGETVDNPEVIKAMYLSGDTVHNLTAGPYSPLSRYGDYMLIVRDEQGHVAWMSGHDTVADRDATKIQLRKTDYKEASKYRIEETKRDTSAGADVHGIDKITLGKLQATVDATIDKVENPQMHDAMYKALLDTYLKSLPQGAFMQHANKRKNTAGATTDALRAFAEYSMSSTRSLATIMHDPDIDSARQGMAQTVRDKVDAGDVNTDQMRDVMTAVDAQMNAAANATHAGWADKTLQAGFISFLASPSQMIINSMQTVMVAAPRLMAKYGARDGVRALGAAVKAYANSRGDLRGDKGSAYAPGTTGRAVMDEMYKRGTFDFTRTNDMAAAARGLHTVENDGSAQSAVTRAWNTTIEFATNFMTKSEHFNRQVTGAAAMELEMRKNPQTQNESIEQFIQRVADVADTAVYDSHFDYSQTNKAAVQQTAVTNVLMQFQQYRLNMLAMMGKDIKDTYGSDPEQAAVARKTLSWMLGSQLAIAGAAGTVLAPVVFALADMFRDEDDLLDSQTEFMRSAPSWLSMGVLSGMIDMSRVGADTLIPYWGAKKYAPNDAKPSELFMYHVQQELGPWLGVGTGISDAVGKLANGDILDAFSTSGFGPKITADIAKGINEMANGVRDAQRVVYFEPNPWDTTLAVMGLKSGSRREAMETRGATFEATMHASNVKKRYLSQVAVGHGTGDKDLVAQGMANVQAWNAAHPDMAIKAQDVMRAVKSRHTSQRNADAYGVPMFKAPTKSVADAVGFD